MFTRDAARNFHPARKIRSIGRNGRKFRHKGRILPSIRMNSSGLAEQNVPCSDQTARLEPFERFSLLTASSIPILDRLLVECPAASSPLLSSNGAVKAAKGRRISDRAKESLFYSLLCHLTSAYNYPLASGIYGHPFASGTLLLVVITPVGSCSDPRRIVSERMLS